LIRLPEDPPSTPCPTRGQNTGIITFTDEPDDQAQADRIRAAIIAHEPLAGKLIKSTQPPWTAGIKGIRSRVRSGYLQLVRCLRARRCVTRFPLALFLYPQENVT
jgi:hypothetical protein